MSYQPHEENDVLNGLLGQPEAVHCFDDWAKRVRDLEDLLTLRLGAVALEHGFASGQALHEANPADLSLGANADLVDALRDHDAATLAEGRLLGRALLALAAQLLPRAGGAPGATVPVARSLLDAFMARLP
jgi:hypothetical protein